MAARPSCRKLFAQLDRREASRADCTAGKSRATRTPMIAITTSSSTSVKPANRAREEECCIPIAPLHLRRTRNNAAATELSDEILQVIALAAGRQTSFQRGH